MWRLAICPCFILFFLNTSDGQKLDHTYIIKMYVMEIRIINHSISLQVKTLFIRLNPLTWCSTGHYLWFIGEAPLG